MSVIPAPPGALVPLRDLHTELRAIRRDLYAADPLGWGAIGFDLKIAISALGLAEVGPIDTTAAPIGPQALRRRLHVARDQLERHLAAGAPAFAELPIAMAAGAVSAALVTVLREIGGFCRLGDGILAAIANPETKVQAA